MRFEDLWRLKEVGQRLKNCLNQVLLLNVDRIEDQWNQLLVLLQHFLCVACLRQIVHSNDGETLQALVIGLQILHDDGVELLVVCADLFQREVLDHDTKQHHGQLFLSQVLRLRILEHKLEELWPLAIWNQYLAKLSNYVCNVLLDDTDRLCNESFKKQVLGGTLISLRQLHEQLSDSLAQIHSRKLSDGLVFVRGHEDKELFKGLHRLEVLLEQSSRLLDNVCIWLLQLGEDLGETVSIKGLKHAVVYLDFSTWLGLCG